VVAVNTCEAHAVPVLLSLGATISPVDHGVALPGEIAFVIVVPICVSLPEGNVYGTLGKMPVVKPTAECDKLLPIGSALRNCTTCDVVTATTAEVCGALAPLAKSG